MSNERVIDVINNIINPFRRRFYMLFLGLVLAAFLEMAGIGLIPAFIMLLANPDRLFSLFPNENMVRILRSLDFNRLTYFGASFLATFFFIKNIFLVFVIFLENRLLRDVSTYLSTSLFAGYIKKPYSYHLEHNPSKLINNITKEIEEVRSFLRAFMFISRELIVLVMIVSLLFFADPMITLSIFSLLGFTGACFYIFIRKNLSIRGQSSQLHRTMQMKAINQGFGALRFVKIHALESYIVNIFKKENQAKEQNECYQRIVASLPRLFLEIMAVCAVLILILILLLTDRPFASLIPIISLQAVAVIRMVPAFNTITASLSMLRYFKPSANHISQELLQITSENYYHSPLTFKQSKIRGAKDKNIGHSKLSLELRNVTFSYKNHAENLLNNISFSVKRGEFIGIIGESGAGKSTLLDLILGLQSPTTGNIFIDGDSINKLNVIRDKIAFIPQEIYLLDDTIKNNITFGISKAMINEKDILLAIKNAQLSKFIENLPDGMDTIIGDRGMRLSGGQRQRLAIARALFRKPVLLIMDEATSALDSSTELEIIEAIKSMNKDKTIIFVTHRLAAVNLCDRVFRLKNGNLDEVKQH